VNAQPSPNIAGINKERRSARKGLPSAGAAHRGARAERRG
jgi:hypothetical protein